MLTTPRRKPVNHPPHDIDHQTSIHRIAHCLNCDWTYDPSMHHASPHAHAEQMCHTTISVSYSTEHYSPSETNFE